MQRLARYASRHGLKHEFLTFRCNSSGFAWQSGLPRPFIEQSTEGATRAFFKAALRYSGQCTSIDFALEGRTCTWPSRRGAFFHNLGGLQLF